MQKIRIKIKVFFLIISLFFASIITGGFTAVFFNDHIAADIQYSKIEYAKLQVDDPNFVSDKKYIVTGQDGYNLDTTQVLGIQGFRLPLTQSNKTINPSNEYTFKGGLSTEKLKEILAGKLAILIDSFKNDTDNSLLHGLSLENVNFTDDSEHVVTSGLLNIGGAEVFMDNCNFYNTLSIVYNFNTKDYKFVDTDKFKERLCAEYVQPSNFEEASCADCTFYPADKFHKLKAEYAIEVINADAIPGGQRFSKTAYNDLLNLYSAATQAGHKMRLTSAYRSYTDQHQVYEAWVQYEMGFGKSRQQAESDANSYSALPGFSEHQLGTTADISSLDCIGIETVCYANEIFWPWLAQNAHNYGFVMSYPMAKDHLTGYIHEPWHYRWIGIELAKEFKEKYENRSYLAEFLRNKKLY